MLNLLPFPFNLIAQAALSAIQKWLVPKITNPSVQALVAEVVQFLLTGQLTPPLQAAVTAHAQAVKA